MREKEIAKLLKLVQESDIEELEVRSWWRKIRITKGKNSPLSSTPRTIYQPVAIERSTTPVDVTTSQLPLATETAEDYYSIKSPMVGTFYRAPEPGAEPFVKEGDKVTVGQVVCIIEAMKIMNRIESEVNGVIVSILIENAKLVEYGQEIFLVKLD